MVAYVLILSIALMDHEDVLLIVPRDEIFGRTIVYVDLHFLAPRRVDDVDRVEHFVFNVYLLVLQLDIPKLDFFAFGVRRTDRLDDW